jgi:hypothetical protein
MKCQQAQPLIPSYLDGELSEAQAGPFRKHLLDCQPCRASAQGDKNMKRWFVDDESMEIPRDFASRVARRAFAGDRGEQRRFESLPRTDFARAPAAAAGVRGESGLRFVLQLTSLAAAALILVSLAIGSLKLPSGNKMQADSTREVKLDRAIEELDRLNEAEKRASVAPTITPASAVTPAPNANSASTPDGSKTSAHATELGDPSTKDAGSRKQ